MSERLDRPVLVLTDHTGSAEEGWHLTGPSAQLLTLARSLTSAEVVAVALNPDPDLTALGAQGVARVLVPELGGRSPRVSAVVADAVEACLEAVPETAAVLCVSNHRGREVAGRLAILADRPAVVDVASIEATGAALRVVKSALAGAWTSTLEVSGTPVLALAPNSVQAEDAPVATAPGAVVVPVTFSDEADAVTVVSSEHEATGGRVDLGQARVVVVGGRGTDGDFSLVEELADLLGGAVGATRVATDEGWVPKSLQVGQTGVTISPDLYIGLGVSGAVHHTVGMQSARRIVAVCDDPDAPILEMADFAVVGDLFEVVPRAIEVLRERRDS